MKKKCPVCQSQRISENKNYVSCNNCPWLHKKTEREKEHGTK